MRVWVVFVNLIVLIAHPRSPKEALDRNKKFKNIFFSSNGMFHKSP